MDQRVVLVDQHDVEIGTETKPRAHVTGALHRAFSVFVFNDRGDYLLQRRASTKYHSPGLWTNTCCSHPRRGESVAEAAHRRLREEMSFDCDLSEAFAFTYRAALPNGLIEHEYDHVLTGTWDGVPRPEPLEVDAWRWASRREVEHEIASAPEGYTVWFRIALDQMRARGL